MCLLYLTFYYKLLFASIALLALGCFVVGPQQIINPNYAIHFSAFTINNGRTNIRQWLYQTYSPPPRYDTFFPNTSHWAELSRPFRALSAISSQHSAISRANKSTTKQINISTIQYLNALRNIRAVSLAL